MFLKDLTGEIVIITICNPFLENASMSKVGNVILIPFQRLWRTKRATDRSVCCLHRLIGSNNSQR